ncbi:broad substrate specificity ATP-binding cassette transporter ABCG2-like [Dysidea avara]|uniref:broad substrate specificity ATP-binding cassette transporter ABCG2-like n=1 Tax=Dysidea avara TaxID=196820 RepID=UPI00331D244D
MTFQVSPVIVPEGKSGAIFFCMICNIFAVIASLELFINERALFIHENSSGYYRVSSYFLSKVIGDLIPLRIIPIPLFSCLAYWMIGFQDNAGKFFLFMLGIFAQNMAASGLVFSIGAIVGVYAAAQTIVSVVLVFAMILLENEVENAQFTYCAEFNGTNCVEVTVLDGNDYLEDLDFRQYNIYWNFLGLGLLALALFILTYIALLRTKKTT